MFIRRVNDRDYDLDHDHIGSLNYKNANTFETFQVMKHTGSNMFALRGYVSGNQFFALYYGQTPGSCIAAMQIIINSWEKNTTVLDFTESSIKQKLEKADLDWLAQYTTYYELPKDIRSNITREFYEQMQNKIKMMEE